ncbi:hypothetical protein KIH39_08445 [Telmatocola sphagniphila]|uniref:Uncharacterized protein n=1 Tax=Telmatocola sphagniphila TaxID=1123043 RepID=A0A8E6BA26_9BACT|nr:hypothetical protein [Telmatocola sphagniphila]QVL33921.1 hypothetical protein KIH39_08445 [Telmatocola sphagniphila]
MRVWPVGPKPQPTVDLKPKPKQEPTNGRGLEFQFNEKYPNVTVEKDGVYVDGRPLNAKETPQSTNTPPKTDTPIYAPLSFNTGDSSGSSPTEKSAQTKPMTSKSNSSLFIWLIGVGGAIIVVAVFRARRVGHTIDPK